MRSENGKLWEDMQNLSPIFAKMSLKFSKFDISNSFILQFVFSSHSLGFGVCRRQRGRRGGNGSPAESRSRGLFILGIFSAFFRQNFARFRLYQNEILQVNMRLTAFFKLYKICILLHRCNLKIFAKNRFEKFRISQNF